MILTLGNVLAGDDLEDIRQAATGLAWSDGGATAGGRARRVKRNEQASLATGAGAALHARLMAAIRAHPVLEAAARPARFSRLLVSRTTEGGGYGSHIDNAVMGIGPKRLRTDLAFTLFLSEPQTYDGGALVIERPGGEQRVRLPAGDLVVYGASSIHRVETVTRGVRLACVGWIESVIRDGAQRELLFDLENIRADLRRKLPPETDELLTLDKSIANLIRMWAE